MSAPEKLAPEVRALLLATLRGRIEAEEKLVRAEFSAALMAGTTLRFRSPLDDEPLGSVLRTDPKAEWRITDERALRAHLAEYPGCIEVTVEIVPEDMPEALAVLAEHAPGLLTERAEVAASAVQAALAQSKATGEPAAPGIEKVRPGGSIQVRPDKAAAETVARMARAGLFEWQSVLALDSGEQEAAS